MGACKIGRDKEYNTGHSFCKPVMSGNRLQGIFQGGNQLGNDGNQGYEYDCKACCGGHCFFMEPHTAASRLARAADEMMYPIAAMEKPIRNMSSDSQSICLRRERSAGVALNTRVLARTMRNGMNKKTCSLSSIMTPCAQGCGPPFIRGLTSSP